MNKNLLIAMMASILAVSPMSAADEDIPMLPNECWWGMATGIGNMQPFTAATSFRGDLRRQNYNNQTSPLLVSNKGRYICAEGPFSIQLAGNDTIRIRGAKGIKVVEAGRTLRDAYRAVVADKMPASGILPPARFFTAPIYNTWIELVYNQNQADILNYARAIVDNGFTPGVLMIDDNWQEDYGVWRFRPDRFPDPKAMVDELHALGFKVMLWVAPFVSPDCMEARRLQGLGLLVKTAHGDDMAAVRWWNGWSAAYDLSNPATVAELHRQFKGLQDAYGIDGFKFDGGDPERYLAGEVSVADGKSFDVLQTQRWAEFASAYPYNELRACWASGNRPLVQRLGDKPYSWDGVSRLVPDMITAALLGYSYSCPDMIGGGDFATFIGVKPEEFDPSLIVRSCQIHSMMPMMQFSVAPWRILAPEYLDICRRYAKLHEDLAPYMMKLARLNAETGEPIVRAMEYEFPGQGFETVNDQYMLGDSLLVAPVYTAYNHRTVRLPKGRWRDDRGKVYKGGRTITVDAPIERLPYFEKL